MTDKVQIGDATLYHGDCLEILPTLDRVDCVVTDPPYGVKKADWDMFFPDEMLWKIIHSILVDGGSLLVIPGEIGLPEKMHMLFSIFDYQWVIPWYKSNAMQFGKTGFSKHSLIWWLSKGKPLAKPKMIDVIDVPMMEKHDKCDHPSPKPIRVITPLVSNFALQTALDPFMGSGTTGVACANLGRKFIGIEIERKYFDIACERIEAAYAQGRLFV